MSVTKLLASAAFLAVMGSALPASASITGDFTSQTTAASSANQLILARRGADDGANHDNGGGRGRGRDDGANHARNGADDGAQHDQGRGHDNGAAAAPGGVAPAPQGVDDGVNHDQGNDQGRGRGRGRGRNDGANHG